MRWNRLLGWLIMGMGGMTLAAHADEITATPAAAAPAHVAGPVTERWTTPQGVRVDFLPSPGIAIVDVTVSLDAGARRDPVGKEGLAALTRALVTSGTAQRDEEAFAEAWADLASELEGGSEEDRVTLSWRTLADAEVRDAAVALVAEMLAQAAFPEAAFTRERARRQAALENALTRPEVLAERAVRQAVYRDHPYGRLATPASIAALTREDVVAFFRRHYTRQGAHIAIVGALSRAEAEQLAEAIAAALPEGEPLPPIPAVPSLNEAQHIAIPHPSEQAHWAIGAAVYRRDDPDYFPLLVANWVLGGGSFSSRLMQEVREARGFAYSVYSSLEPLAQPGPFVIRLQTRGRQSEEARAVVAETLQRFWRDGSSAEEVKLAQSAMADGFGLRIDSNKKLLGFVSMLGYYGLPTDWLATYPDAVRAVTPDKVRAAFARRIDPQRLVWVRVGGDGDK